MAEGVSQIKLGGEETFNVERDVAPISGEAEGVVIVGIVVGLGEPRCIVGTGHRDIGFATGHEMDLLVLHAADDHRVVALPDAE